MTSVHTHVISVPFMLLFVTVITGLETRGMLPGRETLEILNMIESVMYESIRPD